MMIGEKTEEMQENASRYCEMNFEKNTLLNQLEQMEE